MFSNFRLSPTTRAGAGTTGAGAGTSAATPATSAGEAPTAAGGNWRGIGLVRYLTGKIGHVADHVAREILHTINDRSSEIRAG